MRKPQVDTPELSVVVTVYGCADCLAELHRRLSKACAETAHDYELVFVDDRSPDGAWDSLARLARQDPHVHALRLSRNFGQHAAITAGLAAAKGRWVAVIDCDLQEAPEEIPRLMEAARAGYDIVLTRRRERAQRRSRQFGSRVYFRLRRLVFHTDLDAGFSTFSVISRPVVDAFVSMRDRDRQYLLILEWLGYERTVLEIDYGLRPAGRSSYTLGSLIRVALDGLFFHTSTLLRWIVYGGFFVAFAGMGLAAYYVFRYLTADPLPGFTTLAVLLLVLSGAILVSTGVAALYIGRVFEQVKARPLYVVDRDTDVRDG